MKTSNHMAKTLPMNLALFALAGCAFAQQRGAGPASPPVETENRNYEAERLAAAEYTAARLNGGEKRCDLL